MVDFESGYSYAAELLPDSITVDQVTFRLGEQEAYNGLSCKNDTIEIPEGYNRLYFLAAAASVEDQRLQIACGKQTSEFVVPSYTGFVGQWGHEGHTTGYLKPTRLLMSELIVMRRMEIVLTSLLICSNSVWIYLRVSALLFCPRMRM